MEIIEIVEVAQSVELPVAQPVELPVERPPELEVLSCSYSYHAQPFYTQSLAGLPTYLFRLQTEGSSYALVDGRMVKVEAGDLLLYKPGDPYELNIVASANGTTSSGDYFIFAKGNWLEKWWGRHIKSTHNSIDMNEHMISLWRQLILEKRRNTEYSCEQMGYLLRALCLSLDYAITETTAMPSRSFTATRMKRYIEEHATKAFKVEEVAHHVRISVSRAVHLFKETYQKTIIQYALEIRLAFAAERMKYTEMTLEQIARNSGFGSYPYFHRAFKERFGVSPKVFRLQLNLHGSGQHK